MSVILLLIALSLFISGGFLMAYLWSVKNGQFDDEYAAANRPLFDNKYVKDNTDK